MQLVTHHSPTEVPGAAIHIRTSTTNDYVSSIKEDEVLGVGRREEFSKLLKFAGTEEPGDVAEKDRLARCVIAGRV
jgi:hypothetical protein